MRLPFFDFASANFTYHKSTVTVVSPVTDMVYDYNSEIPLTIEVEMYPSGIPGLGAEELAEVRYSVDGLPEKKSSVTNEVNPQGYGTTGYASATIIGLSKGAHELFVRGHTSYGNFSSEIASFNITIYFIVDSVSATIDVISPQQITYNSTTVSLNFKSYESLNWAGYSLDKKLISNCKNNTTITYLSNGIHSLRIYGTDGIGNVHASQSIVFFIDGKDPPVVTLDIEKIVNDRQFLPSDHNQNTWWHLVFHVNEPTSWMGYNIDGGNNQTIEGNTTLGFSYGQYTIVVYAADLCGNIGASTPYTFTLGPGEAGSAYTPPDSNENSTSTQTPGSTDNTTSTVQPETSGTTPQNLLSTTSVVIGIVVIILTFALVLVLSVTLLMCYRNLSKG